MEQYIAYIPGIILLLGVFVEIAPIKISPLSWIGDRVNRNTNSRIDDISSKLNDHIVSENRTEILNFANECLTHKNHTKEQFDYIMSTCDAYETYVEENHIKNGIINEAIKDIRTIYHKCSVECSFLTEASDE